MSSIWFATILIFASLTETYQYFYYHNQHPIYKYPNLLPRAQCQTWCYHNFNGYIQLICCSYQVKVGYCPNTCLFKGQHYNFNKISCSSDHNCPGNFKCCIDPCIPWYKICKVPITNIWSSPNPTTPDIPTPTNPLPTTNPPTDTDPPPTSTAAITTTSTPMPTTETETNTPSPVTTPLIPPASTEDGSGAIEGSGVGIPDPAFADDEDYW